MNESIVRELADIQRRRSRDFDAESLRHRKDAAARRRDRREGIRSRRRFVRCRECQLRPGNEILLDLQMFNCLNRLSPQVACEPPKSRAECQHRSTARPSARLDFV